MTALLYPTCAIVGVQLTEASVAKIKTAFTTVHFYPDGDIPKDLLKDIDVFFSRNVGLPGWINSAEMVPRARLIQLTSAGANIVVKSPLFQDPVARKQIAISSSSGIHAQSIPQYCVGMAINRMGLTAVYMSLHTQFYLTHSKAAWPSRQEIADAAGRHVEGGSNVGFKSLIGATVGLLGYGHIGREAARQFKAMNCKIIAANSSGKGSVDQGYIIPGTGDKEGTLPSKYYSTNDKASFHEFLRKTDILVASLPSTPQTEGLLTRELLELLPDGSILINVGRGTLAKTEDILAVLNAEGGLDGVALDVTDPEPLTAGSPLYTHPKAIITPHSSGDFVGYFEACVDVLVSNVEQIRNGGPPMNKVDPDKGY